MPILKNPRHEAFVQYLYEGCTAKEAYEKAGYKPSEPHSSRLASNGKIRARMAELQAERAEKAGDTVDGICADLRAIQKIAVDNKQPSAAVNAVMGIAKLRGFIVDKAEIRQIHDINDLSTIELRQLVASARSRVGASGDGIERPPPLH